MAISIFKCHYHAEVSGKLLGSFGNHTEYVAAATGDPATLQSVLASNGKDVPSGSVIKFDAIQNVGITALS